MAEFPIFEAAKLEIRRSGGMRTLSGRFNYGSTATIRDRGRVRKERFEPRAFRFAIEDETRQLDVLVGHDFGKPIASRKAGTLAIADGDDALPSRLAFPMTRRHGWSTRRSPLPPDSWSVCLPASPCRPRRLSRTRKSLFPKRATRASWCE